MSIGKGYILLILHSSKKLEQYHETRVYSLYLETSAHDTDAVAW